MLLRSYAITPLLQQHYHSSITFDCDGRYTIATIATFCSVYVERVLVPKATVDFLQLKLEDTSPQ